MSYITLQDLEEEVGADKLVQLTDNDRAGEVNADVAEKAIAYAVGMFDSYARTRYSLPVPATAQVKAVCLDLAIYKLRRSRATTSEATEALKKSLYDPAVKYLEALQSGRAALDVPAAEETEVSPASPDRVLSGTKRTTFDDGNLGSY